MTHVSPRAEYEGVTSIHKAKIRHELIQAYSLDKIARDELSKDSIEGSLDWQKHLRRERIHDYQG